MCKNPELTVSSYLYYPLWLWDPGCRKQGTLGEMYISALTAHRGDPCYVQIVMSYGKLGGCSLLNQRLQKQFYLLQHSRTHTIQASAHVVQQLSYS